MHKEMRKGNGQAKRAGPARQHTGKKLSDISLSLLSPKQVRCSEMLCYAQLLNENNDLYVTEGYTYFI